MENKDGWWFKIGKCNLSPNNTMYVRKWEDNLVLLFNGYKTFAIIDKAVAKAKYTLGERVSVQRSTNLDVLYTRLVSRGTKV